MRRGIFLMVVLALGGAVPVWSKDFGQQGAVFAVIEPDLLAVIEAMKARGAAVPIPTDVVTAKTFAADAPATIKAATDVADDDLILDIGPQTASQLAERAQLDRARTSRAITSLAAKKLLLRTTRPGDRRQATLALTAAGRALFEELFPQVQVINERLLSVLAPRDADRLDAMLDALQGQADLAQGQADLPKADRRRGRRSARTL